MSTQRTRRQSVAALQGKQHVSGKAGGPGTVAPEGVETGTDSDDDSLEAYGLSEGEDEGASRFTKYICGAHPWLQLLKIDMHTPSSMRGLMSCHHLVGRVCHWTLRAVHCQHVSTYEAIKGNDSNVPGLLELLLGLCDLVCQHDCAGIPVLSGCCHCCLSSLMPLADIHCCLCWQCCFARGGAQDARNTGVTLHNLSRPLRAKMATVRRIKSLSDHAPAQVLVVRDADIVQRLFERFQMQVNNIPTNLACV